MEISRFRESGGPSARSMMESIVLHTILLALLLLVGATFLARSGAPRTKNAIDIVFYRPAAVPVPPPAVAPPPPKGADGAAKARASEAPKGPGKPDLPAGPAKGFSADATPPEPSVSRAGILAFKEQFASLAQDQNAPRLGSDARYAAADEVGQASSHSVLTTNTLGSSGGIDAGSLSRNVGGGGGRGGGGGGMGGPRSRGSAAATADPRPTAAQGLRAPTKKFRSCSIVTSRLSTGITTGHCASIPHCKARWCCA